MLRGLHKATSNWLGRAVTGVLLGLIAVSFAIWGVGDIFRGFGRSTVAKIGRTEITIEQFRQTYNDKLQQLGRQLGRPITTDQAMALGLPRQLLGQVIAETALDENARQMRLGLSDADIAKRITSDPSFRGPTGQFDRARFDQIIRQAGYTEARFVAEQRKTVARREIAEAISGGMKAPATAVEAQHRFVSEERKVEFILLDRAQAGEITPPAEDVLNKYFEERKSLFRAPEYRKLDLLVLSPQDNARAAEISDADARKAYDDRRARYVTPESRELQQIAFPSAEDARAASERLKGGATFEQIATDRGLKAADINLGAVTKAAMLDSTVADAAFKLAVGQASEPIAGRFGSVIVRTTRIEPEKVRPFEDVASEIKRELAQDRAKTEIADLHNKIEDERGGGAALADVAKKVGLTTRVIEAIDRSGRDPDGNLVAGLPTSADIMASAFGSDVGVENDGIKLADGGYAWFEVMATTPSRERPLTEVRERVVQAWTDDQIAARLKTKSGQLADAAKSGGLEKVAQDTGLRVQSASNLRRGRAAGPLSANMVGEIFRSAKGEIGNIEGDRPTLRAIYRITEVTVPKLDPASQEASALSERMLNATFEDLLTQYVSRLQSDLGTSINETALNQVLTGGSGTN